MHEQASAAAGRPSQSYKLELEPFMGTVRAEIANMEYAYGQQVAMRYGAVAVAEGGEGFERLVRDKIAVATEDAASLPASGSELEDTRINAANIDQILGLMPARLEHSAHVMGQSDGPPTALKKDLVLLQKAAVKYPDRLAAIDLGKTTTYLCLVRAAAALDARNNNHSRARPRGKVGDRPTRLAPIYLDVIKPLIRVKARQRMLLQ